MLAHLPEYSRTTVEVCRQGTIPPLPCYNNSRCPCTNATVFLMAGSAADHKGAPLKPSTMISGWYSSWPVFPAEHIDVDSPVCADTIDASSTAGLLFATSPNSLGVLDWPHGIRMSAGRGAEGPYEPAEPGAQPVSIITGLTDWLTWSTTSPRPWTPWSADQARGNLFPFINPAPGVYAGGLVEIGVSMAINDMLLITTGWPINDPIIRLFPGTCYCYYVTVPPHPAKSSELSAQSQFAYIIHLRLSRHTGHTLTRWCPCYSLEICGRRRPRQFSRPSR